MGAEASAAVGVVLLDLPGLGQQVGAAGWWVLLDGLAGQGVSAAGDPGGLPVIAAGGAGRASAVGVVAGVDPLLVSGLGLLEVVSAAAAGNQTAASGLEGSLPGFAEENPDQREVSGLVWLPDLEAVAGLQALG